MKKLVALIVLLLMLFISVNAVIPPLTTAAAEESGKTYTLDDLLALWYKIGAMLKENGYYPYVQLQKDDHGYEVRLLQARLAELGYYNKALADNFGNGTYAAMRQFETVNNLLIDGIASVADQMLLFTSKAIPNTGVDINQEQGAIPTPAAGTDGPIQLMTLPPVSPVPDPGGNGIDFPGLITIKPPHVTIIPIPTDSGINLPGNLITIKPPVVTIAPQTTDSSINWPDKLITIKPQVLPVVTPQIDFQMPELDLTLPGL